MPGPLDYLKKGASKALTPLISQEAADPYINAVDSRRTTENQDMFDPNSMLGKVEGVGQRLQTHLGGFGAGSMNAMRGMTSPAEIAANLSPFGGTALRALRGASGIAKGAGAMAKAARPTLDLIEPSVVKQVAPAMDDVNSLIGDLQRNLSRVPNKRPVPADTGRFVDEVQSDWQGLGGQLPEFTPRGGEGIYNAGRNMANQAGGAMDGLYQELMRKFNFGR